MQVDAGRQLGGLLNRLDVTVPSSSGLAKADGQPPVVAEPSEARSSWRS
jgi:hypothetical protein